MSQPFEVADEKVTINGATIVSAGRFAVFGEGLPEDFGRDAQEKADLLERRLQRIEAALGFDATDASLENLASALNQL
ncbi:hypothetical protein BK635_13105 [Pseudomonas chlororaphis]|uniref:hypothetical protein n=1 Tax=Pseudomonas chlororaphis TaxID=587753 RepID=UPI000F470536|nr:hypothetical protein [Pseudomonas chlororaphis]RON82434.1 hypothetical protein BK635_13105 [Pseudomonas chlororaphis]